MCKRQIIVFAIAARCAVWPVGLCADSIVNGIAEGAGNEDRIIVLEGATGDYYQVSGDTLAGTMDIAGETLTNGGAVYLDKAYSTNDSGLYADSQLMRSDDVNDRILSVVAQQIYGSTNEHPVLTGAGSMVDTIPALQWTNATALSTDNGGTNLIGAYFYTNPVQGFIPAGNYTFHLHAFKSGGGNSMQYGELIESDGTTTNVLCTSTPSSRMTTVMLPFDLNCKLNTNSTRDSSWYLGVLYYAVRTGGAVTLYTVGGGSIDTSLHTPNLNTSLNYATADEMTAVEGATNDAQTRYYNVDGDTLEATMDAGGFGLTNLGDCKFTALELDISDQDLDGKGSIKLRPNNDNIDATCYLRVMGTNAVEHGDAADSVDVSVPAGGAVILSSNGTAIALWQPEYGWDMGDGSISNVQDLGTETITTGGSNIVMSIGTHTSGSNGWYCVDPPGTTNWILW